VFVRETGFEQEDWEAEFEEKIWIKKMNEIRWKEESRRRELYKIAHEEDRIAALQEWEKKLTAANAKMDRVTVETDDNGRRIFRRQES